MKIGFDNTIFACPHCGAMQMDAKFISQLTTVQFGMQEDLIITSGYRCPTHNAAIGGAPDSRHILGLAVDIAMDNGPKRWLLIKLAMMNGMNGIGIGRTFVHLDGRPESQRTTWLYPISE